MRRDTLHGVSAHAYLKVSATIPRLHTAVKSLVPEGIPGMEFVVAGQSLAIIPFYQPRL